MFFSFMHSVDLHTPCPSVLQSGWRHTDSSASRVCYSSAVRIDGAVSSLSRECLETHGCVVSEVRGWKPWERVG